jgi:hypothetical protein
MQFYKNNKIEQQEQNIFFSIFEVKIMNISKKNIFFYKFEVIKKNYQPSTPFESYLEIMII